MTFDNSNIAPGSSIIFRIPSRLNDTRLLGYSVHNVGKLPVSKRGLAIVCDIIDKMSYKRVNGKNVLTLTKHFTS